MEEEVWLSAEVVNTLLAVVEEVLAMEEEVWPSAEVVSTLLVVVEVVLAMEEEEERPRRSLRCPTGHGGGGVAVSRCGGGGVAIS